jgi:hypothetical protein
MMKLFSRSEVIIFLVIVLLISTYSIPVSLSKKVDQASEPCTMINGGQILYSPMWSTTTYLIESSGTINHTWSSIYFPGVMTRWLGDGEILRTIRVDVGPGTGGTGGGVQKVEWDGTVVWDFRYNTNGVLSHHDVRILPNGNVLLIAWETKTREEAISAGRNPNFVSSSGFMPDHIIEVKPTGPTSGEIVWEWHVWDHLIQNYDSSKENYGIVVNHPELVDINYASTSETDWLHMNSIDYNEKFDQILLSAHNFNEIWVIDHSTTTAEAAGHTGGNSGKGGDLLYRWGNPQAYGRGTSSDQKLFLQHDANWVDEGYPGEGDILIFNNGCSRFYSTVDEIVPPVDNNGNYYLGSGSKYGPTEQIWIYNPQPSFYSTIISGAQRLPNGNTLICNGETGEIFEVTHEGAKVWQYYAGAQVFKVEYVPPEEPTEDDVPDLVCTGSLSWSNVKPGATLTGSFQLQNSGGKDSLLNWTIDNTSITWGTWSFTPQFGDNLKPDDGPITIQVSVIAPDEKNTKFEGFIQVKNLENISDYEIISVSLKNLKNIDNYRIRFSFIQHFILKLQQWFLPFERILNLHLLH